METEEGYKLIASECQCGGRKGMTACMIPSNRAVLFGGCALGTKGESIYPNDLWMISESEDSSDLIWQKLDTEGESPVGRAFHTAALLGHEGRHMAVCGGYDNKRLQDDMWLLDMSSLFVTDIDSIKPKVKGKGTLPRWSRIELPSKSPAMRFMHNSFVSGSSILVFGGIGEYGVLDATVHEIVLAEGNNDDTFKFTEIRSYACSASAARIHSAALAVLTDQSSDNHVIKKPVTVFTFGGATENAYSSVLFVDEHQEVSKAIFRRVKDLYPDPPQIPVPVKVTHIQYPNGDEYEGDLVEEDTVRHGFGKMRYAADGAVYEGDWVLGQRHGQGTITFPDGSRYIGSFDADKRTGHGKLLSHHDKVMYEGKWHQDRYHGSGIHTGVDGEVYEGALEGGERHGHGVLTGPDGSVYTGEFEKGLRSGRGVQVYPNGDRYEGEFLNDKRHGRGVCKYVTGAEYTGSWRVDVPNGYGTYIAPTLDEYQGKWVAGRRCGKGAWRSAHGEERYEGLWDADLPNGEGRKVYADGSVYTGSFVGGKRHGLGSHRTQDGAEYSGEFVHDKRHGRGRWRGSKGCRPDDEVTYEGDWKDDKRHGEGRSSYASGSVYEGVYLHDAPRPF